ncbi:hypothetical protein [Microvirga sp. 2TAF3]|uniref:hypothetical protein n=1 Tax=Microvirga sp. 2TAF3 TaxID=3233014 RepID=UPI003F946702
MAGELLARHARTIFDFGARLGEDLRAVAEGGLGSVRLNATLSVLAGHPLAQALADFQSSTPGPDGVLPIYNPDLRLAGVRLAEPWAQRQVRLVSRPAAMLTPSARLLLDYLSASPGLEAQPERSRMTDPASAK